MSIYTDNILRDIKRYVVQNFIDFRNFLKMVIPLSDEDETQIDVTIDMLNQLIADINDASQLSDLKCWFNLRDMIDDWEGIEHGLAKDYSADVQTVINTVVDEYTSRMYPEED